MMRPFKKMPAMSAVIRTGVAGVALLGLGACAYDSYGYGGGVGYASAEYAGGYYGDGQYDNYYGDPYGYRSVPFGYAGAGFGWFGDYYYPGTGYYVYDRRGGRRNWSSEQQRYWGERARARRDFAGERRDDRRDFRAERRDDRGALATGQVTPGQFRADRQADRDAYRDDRRDDRRDYRQDPQGDRREGWNGRRGDGQSMDRRGAALTAPAPLAAPAAQAMPMPMPAPRVAPEVRAERQAQRQEYRAEQQEIRQGRAETSDGGGRNREERRNTRPN